MSDDLVAFAPHNGSSPLLSAALVYGAAVADAFVVAYLAGFVSVFVDGEDARYLERAAPIRTEVRLLPAISGG